MRAIFPPYRHIVVKTTYSRYPAEILVETPSAFNTRHGLFMKDNRKKWGHPEVTFEGPFTAEGDMENMP